MASGFDIDQWQSPRLHSGGRAAGVNSVTGAVYVFVEPPGGWQTTSKFTAELTASDGTAGSALGYSVSMAGNTIAAGAYGTNAAYIFVEPTSGWANDTETARLTAPADVVGSNFGYSLSLRGNKLAVGSANDPSKSSVFVFIKPASGWATTTKYNARLTSSDGTAGFRSRSVEVLLRQARSAPTASKGLPTYSVSRLHIHRRHRRSSLSVASAG